jgi:cytochrome P450
MRAAIKVLDDFSYGIIDEREKAGLGNITADDKKDKTLDLLSLYMALRDENGQPMSRKALRDAVLNLIIAGRDTTAQALSWTFFHLLKKGNSVLAPVRDELDQLRDAGAEVDYDSFRSLTQTNAVFAEGLRLHPSVPKNGWTAVNDDVIPDGPIIKKGDIVFWR